MLQLIMNRIKRDESEKNRKDQDHNWPVKNYYYYIPDTTSGNIRVVVRDTREIETVKVDFIIF